MPRHETESTLSMIDEPDETRDPTPGPAAGGPGRPMRGLTGIRRVGRAGRRFVPFVLGVLATFLAIRITFADGTTSDAMIAASEPRANTPRASSSC